QVELYAAGNGREERPGEGEDRPPETGAAERLSDARRRLTQQAWRPTFTSLTRWQFRPADGLPTAGCRLRLRGVVSGRHTVPKAPVAQFDRAPDYGSGGFRSESCGAQWECGWLDAKRVRLAAGVAPVEESPSSQGGVPANSRASQDDGKCNREAPAVGCASTRGKGETVV